MIVTFALALLVANAPPKETSLPRRQDANPVEQRPVQQERPTDPLFDRPLVATDDPAFVLGAIESSRQGVIDGRAAEQTLAKAELRTAAAKIARQNETTRDRLESLAKRKGWRLPEANPGRTVTSSTASSTASAARAGADFIIHQISYHENTVAQFRAQIAGKGDADLKRILRDTVKGYQDNLELLLSLSL
jgi:hypothetical protein